MNPELFRDKFSKITSEWHSARENFLSYWLGFINANHVYSSLVMNAIERDWQYYKRLNNEYQMKLVQELPKENLLDSQKDYLYNYIDLMKKHLMMDKLLFSPSPNSLADTNYSVPLPTLEEQLEVMQIFPNTPAYHSFDS